MLYVFQMDMGQMLTFDISLLMDMVSRLQLEIARTTGIAIDKQILLVSGGHSLKPDQKVMTYGAGADTNPVFLFSKIAIESQEPPLVRSVGLSKEFLGALREKITDALNLPATFDTVVTRTKLACQIRDSASKILSFCNNEFKEQHLQYQGWGTVVANLEEIAQAMHKTEVKFSKAFQAFLPLREKHFSMLDNFNETIELLDRIPLLKSLREEEEGMEEDPKAKSDGDDGGISFIAHSTHLPSTLLEWITTQGQGQSLEALQYKCSDDLKVFNTEMYEMCDRQVQELLALVTSDPHHMKELVGIERRLSELEKRLNEAKKIAKEQSDMAQGFLNHQSRLGSTHDAATVLPDLCKSHRHQMMQMLERQQRMEALQNNFRKSKQEMSTNIHQRLGWVMHIETQISKLDSDLIFHLKTLRILECNIELLSQVKAAPQVYAHMVVEAARRKLFSGKFFQWTETLVEDSSQLYATEVERRKQFSRKIGEHFLLDTLFKGFEDMPPSFATKSPPRFDVFLPNVTPEDIALLRHTVPELEASLSMPMEGALFPGSLLSGGRLESPLSHLILPHSQSSQTEWSEQLTIPSKEPSVVTATEAPATKFTLPELQESRPTAHRPSVSTTGVRHDITRPDTKTTSDARAVKSEEVLPAGETAKSRDVASGGSDSSAKMHTKTNSTNTDSTSPLSSNEFATADFYFEDSMPSPMEDSPLGKKEGRKLDTSKSDSEITSLQSELAEKISLILDLEKKLKELTAGGSSDGRRDGGLEESSVLKDGGHPADHTQPPSSLEFVSCDVVQEAEKDTQEIQRMSTSVKEEERSVTSAKKDSKDPGDPSRGGAGDESVCVEKLLRELEQAHAELLTCKTALSDAETKVQVLGEQNEKITQEKDDCIQKLKGQFQEVNDELSTASTAVLNKQETINDLEKALCDSKIRSETLEEEVKKGEESLERIRNRLMEFRTKLTEDIPFLRKSVEELKGSVLNSKSELDSAVALAITSMEKELSAFNSSVLASVCAENAKEKDALRAVIQSLKADLNASQSQSLEKVMHLSSAKEELASQLVKQQEEFEKRWEQQKQEFDASLKDLETKHALEMELEIDRCRAEMREGLEEAERNVERLDKMRGNLSKDLEKSKHEAEVEKEEMVKRHKDEVEKLHRDHASDKVAVKAALTQEFEKTMEQKVTEGRAEVEELTAKLESAQSSLVAEKEQELGALRAKLSREYESQMADLKIQIEEQKLNLKQVLEHTQLDHAHKLTDLKTQFDMEREALTAEVSKIKNRVRHHRETQTDFQHCHADTQTYSELHHTEMQTDNEWRHTNTQTDHELLARLQTHSHSQTDLEGVAEQMTHSETQTGLDLLADIISLTSSASYGSEEMIAHKQPSTITDDKDSSDTTKTQQTFDDLSTQLSSAKEKISSLDKEVAALKTEKKELIEKLTQAASESRSKSQMVESCGLSIRPELLAYQEMMQSTNTTTSFMVMDSRPPSIEINPADADDKAKDQKIAELRKKLMEMSMTASEREMTSDKVSIRVCDKGDLVLLCLDERHDQYVVFTVGTILHFLHSDSLECLGLKKGSDPTSRKSWILAEVVDKEYCLAKKPNNRFRVPQGTCFYRVKCKPWKSDVELPRQEKEPAKQVKATKHDQGAGAKPKKHDHN